VRAFRELVEAFALGALPPAEAYGPGEIAYRRPGSVHSIEILPGEDCVSYAASYGEIEVIGT
jgi:hypothetical protein